MGGTDRQAARLYRPSVRRAEGGLRRILAFVDYYLPGFKGGGPAVSVSRRAESLKGKAEFFVFTRDRDLGDTAPYPNVASNEWNDKVFYASPQSLRANEILKAIRSANPDAIYLNSHFSHLTRMVLKLRTTGALEGITIVLAPRGELDAGALRIKRTKKALYLALTRRRHAGLRWHATSQQECDVIKMNFPNANVLVAQEIAPEPQTAEPAQKTKGACSFVYLSRVSRKKNLHFLVKAMRGLQGQAELNVYGPIEDNDYWQLIQDEARTLPKNVAFTYHGPVEPVQVPAALSRHHVFVLPTLGENHCHAIAEALAAGLPCLISDTTPWTHEAGWALPLADPDAWAERLQKCVDMDGAAYRQTAARTQAYFAQKALETVDFEPVLAA